MAYLRASYPQGTRFKKLAQAMAKISDEGVARFTPDEALFWIFSPDKTVLGVFRLPHAAFDELNVDPAEGLGLQVNLGELYKVSRRATRNDAVVLQYETGSPGLTLELQDRKTGLTRSFTVTASETSETEFREINMNPTARVVLSADDLGVLIADAKTVGDIVELRATGDKLIATARAEEKEYTWVMTAGSPLQEISVSEETRASYGVKSLYSSLRPIVSVAESVTLEFSTDYPLKITASIAGAESVVIYIAPVQG